MSPRDGVQSPKLTTEAQTLDVDQARLEEGQARAQPVIQQARKSSEGTQTLDGQLDAAFESKASALLAEKEKATKKMLSMENGTNPMA